MVCYAHVPSLHRMQLGRVREEVTVQGVSGMVSNGLQSGQKAAYAL
jgi:hypothetical protein